MYETLFIMNHVAKEKGYKKDLEEIQDKKLRD
ncbi:hypothetical protein IGK_05355 [Bacillus toyonensis]|nr:hypothetical protein IGK_05355 [Bacillus toyonensis]EJV42412.1 hypothetical protein IEA_05185 [Bacillus toyonensis]